MIPAHQTFPAVHCAADARGRFDSYSGGNLQTCYIEEVDSVYPDAHELYIDAYPDPELSSHEVQTVETLAARWRKTSDMKVTERVGGTGIVAVMKNGAGSTVMPRTGIDASPVEEKNYLACAGKVHAKGDDD